MFSTLETPEIIELIYDALKELETRLMILYCDHEDKKMISGEDGEKKA